MPPYSFPPCGTIDESVVLGNVCACSLLLFCLPEGSIFMLREANVRKMLVDESQWGAWQGYQFPISDAYVSIWTPLGTQMHWRPGTWLSHKHQISYFWPNEWYVIHNGYHEDGSFASSYCDIVLPTPTYSSTAHELLYVDLYIDVVVREDGSVYTKDQEVFDRAALHYPIVEESRKKSFEMLDWLEAHAKAWTGPFAVMPHQLPRTDFETLSVEQARASWHVS